MRVWNLLTLSLLAIASIAWAVPVEAQEKPAPAAAEGSGSGSSAAPGAAAADEGGGVEARAEQLGLIDGAFERFVDLRQIPEAVENQDAGILADLTLGLAEGERVLYRKHRSGASADELFKRTVALASRKSDEETLARLKKAADALGKAEWKQSLEAATLLGAGSRAGTPKFDVEKLSEEDREFFQRVTAALEEGKIVGNRAQLEQLQSEVNGAEKVAKEVKEFLTAEIKSAIAKSAEELDETAKVLSAASRGGTDVRGYRVIPGGPTYAEFVESGINTYFPAWSYSGPGVKLSSSTSVSRVEANGRGGWWLTMSKQWTAKVFGNVVASARVTFYYDNGGVRVDVSNIKGAFNSRGATDWIIKNLQSRNPFPGPSPQPSQSSYTIKISNQSGRALTVYVRMYDLTSTWVTKKYSFASGETAFLADKTKNSIIYFRAEGTNYRADGGATGVTCGDGRKYQKVDMGSGFKTYTFTFK